METSDAPRPRGGPLAARIRAALAYGDLKRPAAAEALGVSVETVSRWTAGNGEPSLETRQLIADLSGVPRSFLEHGFVDIDEIARARMPELIDELTQDEDAVRALAGILAPHLAPRAAPATDASPAQRAAVRRLGGAGERSADPDQRSQRPGRP